MVDGKRCCTKARYMRDLRQRVAEEINFRT
jgi:hypothetical protein